MIKDELILLQSCLEELYSYQENAGCNDFSMDKTPSNIVLMKKLNDYQGENVFKIQGKEIQGFDLCVTSYIMALVEKEINSL